MQYNGDSFEISFTLSRIVNEIMSAPVVFVQQPRQGAPVAAYAMHPYILPAQFRQASFGISVTLVIAGLGSILMGGLGFSFYRYWYFLSVTTGVDFWVGIAVSTSIILKCSFDIMKARISYQL